jgi:ribose transport system permease protein
MENTEKQKSNWRKYTNKLVPLLSLAGLIFLVIVYLFVVDFSPTPFHIQTIINQVAIIAVLSTGAVFIFSLGSFDISLGVAVGVAACFGILVYNAGAGVWGMFGICIGIGVVAGTINATLSSVFKMPVFIMTIAMMSVLTAVMQILMSGMTTIRIESDIIGPIRDLNNVWLRLGFMAVFFAICVVLFNYTKVGKRNKILGSNPRVAALTGISIARQTIITFLISGMGVGIASFIMIGRAQSISSDTGSSFGIDVMMAIVFGGMPLSGGAYSKIGAGLVGSISMVLLSQILTILGASAGMSQIYRAVLFLIIVFVASFSYREKMLARVEMF